MRTFCLENHASLQPNNQKKVCKGFARVNDLRGIEVYTVSFRNRILISVASNLRYKIECGILVPKQGVYRISG